jgi:hypothetical protein
VLSFMDAACMQEPAGKREPGLVVGYHTYENRIAVLMAMPAMEPPHLVLAARSGDKTIHRVLIMTSPASQAAGPDSGVVPTAELLARAFNGGQIDAAVLEPRHDRSSTS